MKGLVLCSVLFCALALVLVYAAFNGLGARTPSLVPITVVMPTTTTDFDTPTRIVKVQDDAPAESKAQSIRLPAPEVTIARPIRKRKGQPAKLAPKAESSSYISAVAFESAPKVLLKSPVKEHLKATVAPKVEKPAPAEPSKEPEAPVFKPRDVTDAGP